MTQPVLDTLLAQPPKPVARLTAMLQSGGKKCPTCGKKAKIWATARPDSDHGHKAWRRLLVDRLRLEWWNRKPINGPIRVTLCFVIQRPQSRPIPPKTVQRKKMKIPNPRRLGGDFYVQQEDWDRGQRVLCPVIPDVDRLTNAVFDGLTEVGVWWDDAQVASLRTEKWYAAEGEEPSIRLRVEAA